MRKYEITFSSINSETYPKTIVVFVIEPDNINTDTGAMLFTHGWGGNRFQHQDKMEYSAEKFNLVCISAEYRQSGYDFDPVKGLGAYRPYDAGFYQVFDVLNSLREIIHLRPNINRRRIFHYGGSQGGHIALLSSIFAPDTFAFVYASSPITHITKNIEKWTGRTFKPYELSVRNMIEHAGRVKTPLFLEHGTSDNTVHVSHTKFLEKKLKELHKTCTVTYYKGGEHNLEPAITKLDAFKSMASDPMEHLCSDGNNDFIRQNKIEIPCAGKTLAIDWSKSASDVDLFQWI